ncbi:nitric oxide synthase [Marinobacter fuscus]|uniref:NADPH--hemoprotein reductase n=1 Tax=Marinobacter fuscus TaxID=2109942 RepID=A0A2T1K3N9_9GAMM|nr:PepSY domain-containing protein [Marinobacter fuscus]PSF04695.1 nitric oxide synthase [Marinobacter fuscus]
MLRKLHGLPGLLVALLLVVLAVSGSILSVVPALDRARAVVPATDEIHVAELAGRVVAHYPGAEQIVRDLSGQVVVYFSEDGQAGADRIDPRTGASLGPYQPSPFWGWVKNLHRSFLLASPGRFMAGMLAAMMGFLCVSGVLLLVRRNGGWKALMQPMAGTGSQRIHAVLARLACLGLLLSAVTGALLSAQRFGLLPEASDSAPAFPAEVSGGQPVAVSQLKALAQVDLNELRELVFPYPDDPQDVYSLTTAQGMGFVDQSSGELLQFQPHAIGGVVQHWILRLHTGEGLWWLALLLGVSALSVPVLSVTGARIWWHRRSSATPCDSANIPDADMVVLVGSESGTTWGFARALQRSLSQAGFRVHCADMNALATDYPKASTLLLLTSTYGDGEAPASAGRFLERLQAFQPSSPLDYAVLGFGDRQFTHFCRYALRVDEALSSKGLNPMLPPELIDRCSVEKFCDWGRQLGARLGVDLALHHDPVPPATFELELVERVDYGCAVQAPTSILRFRMAGAELRLPWLRSSGPRRLPAFEAGDLLGVLPPGAEAPRFYSLASSRSEGVFEICVRKQPGGLCSGFLHSLKPGDTVAAFVRPNPGFRPAADTRPVILIGAGAGIGPLTGFIRKNKARNPMYLYWGGRSPTSDFLYQPELGDYLEDHRLTGLSTAFSRADGGSYVQDKLRQDQKALRQLVETGAQILVCGGREMANGVRQVFDDLLAPLRLNVDVLQQQGRYLEDVF